MKGKENSLGRRIGSDSVPAENGGADDAICTSLVTTMCERKCASRYKPHTLVVDVNESLSR